MLMRKLLFIYAVTFGKFFRNMTILVIAHATFPHKSDSGGQTTGYRILKQIKFVSLK